MAPELSFFPENGGCERIATIFAFIFRNRDENTPPIRTDKNSSKGLA